MVKTKKESHCVDGSRNRILICESRTIQGPPFYVDGSKNRWLICKSCTVKDPLAWGLMQCSAHLTIPRFQ